MTVFAAPLTGRKVAAIFVGAFATIIGANLALVYYAVGSFPGIEVKNTYQDSMAFQDRRAQQELLNWSTGALYENGTVVLSIRDTQGHGVITERMDVVVGLATTEGRDMPVPVQFDGADYVAAMDLPDGNWQLRISAVAMDGTPFRQFLPLIVRSK